MLRARHVLSTTGATLVGGGLALGLTVLVARLLTPSQNGHYAQFVLVFNLVYIGLNFGLGPTSTFFVASGRASVQSVSRVNLGVMLMLACLMLIAAWGIHLWEVDQLVESLLNIPSAVLYAGLAAGVLLLSFNQVTAILMGAHQYDVVNALNVARTALPLLFIAATALAWAPTVASLAVVQVVAMGMALLLALWAARHAMSKGKPSRVDSSAGNLQAMLGYGGLVYLSNLLHYLAMRGLLLLLSHHGSPESVGFLSLALLLLEVTLLLPSAIGQLVFPQSSSAGFDRGALEIVLRVNLYISLVVIGLILLLARPVVTLLLGNAYQPVAHVLVHLSPSVALLAVPRILSQLLSGQGHPRYPLAAAAISLCLGTLVAIWAIPQWGYVAAAWVTNLVSAITAGVTVVGYCRIYRVRALDVFRPRNRDWRRVQSLVARWVGR